MSGSTTPTGGYMRQRHNSQGYASSGDDLEDDASSSMHRGVSGLGLSPRVWSRREIAENVIWLVSAVGVVYLGDFKSNMIFLLWQDDRIRRLPLYIGLVGVVLNFIIFCYTSISAWRAGRLDEKWELTSIAALSYVTLLGALSFCLFCFALWPIWGFLTLPLLFTLFMAGVVICSYIIIGIFRKQHDASSDFSDKLY